MLVCCCFPWPGLGRGPSLGVGVGVLGLPGAGAGLLPAAPVCHHVSREAGLEGLTSCFSRPTGWLWRLRMPTQTDD